MYLKLKTEDGVPVLIPVGAVMGVVGQTILLSDDRQVTVVESFQAIKNRYDKAIDAAVGEGDDD